MAEIQLAAAALRERGIGIVWLHAGEKNPHRRGWTKQSQEPADYTSGDNLGILTGVLSGNLVCVDLDSADAIRLAETYLPPTGMIDGRLSKQRSHYFYRVTDIPPDETSGKGPSGGPCTRRFAGVLDFLGTGAQATAPPSIVKGEPRIWLSNDEPATITYADLRAAVDRIVTELSPPANPVGRPRKHTPSLPSSLHVVSTIDVPPLDLAEAWFSQHEPAITGQDGRRRTYVAARHLTNDFALSVDDAWPLLLDWNRKCQPPWAEAELRQILVNAAEAPEDPKYPRGRKLRVDNGQWDDPDRLAHDFAEEQTWKLWNKQYWRYVGTHYAPSSEDDLSIALTAFVQKTINRHYARMYKAAVAKWRAKLAEGQELEFKPPTKPKNSPNRVRSVLTALLPKIQLHSEARLSSMIHTGTSPNYLAVKNGLLDLDTFELSKHTSKWFSRNCLPIDYDPTADPSYFPSVLSSMLEDDPACIDLLQEWFGYCLWRGFEAEKYMILVGDGGTGKSTVLTVLQAMIGEPNTSTVKLKDMGENRFAFAPTLGMMVNVSFDTDSIDRFGEGVFKAFVSGERIQFERKGVDSFEAYPTAKIILGTNELPNVFDKSDGMYRRILYIPMNRQIPQHEKIQAMKYASYWTEHLPGILNWALGGLRRLRANSWTFTEPEASKQIAQEHRKESDPAHEFLTEHFTYDPTAEPLAKHKLYDFYRSWSQRSGIKMPLKQIKFNRCVRQTFKGVDEKSLRIPDHRAPVGYYAVTRSWLYLRQTVDIEAAVWHGQYIGMAVDIPADDALLRDAKTA
jgi:P4 family phage/plasmid primase-like protien